LSIDDILRNERETIDTCAVAEAFTIGTRLPFMKNTPVLIAGAGPTGLVLALWLTRAGVPVRIIDKAAEPGTTSRALGVQARTLELYRQLGIANEVVDAGYRVSAVNLWTGDSRVGRVPFGDMGAGLSPFPYLLIFPQDEHERFLVRHLETLGVRVERSTELVTFAETPTGVRATLKGPDGTESACDATYIAGCDGAHSKVRETLGIGFPGGTYAEYFYVADVEATGPIDTREVYGALDGFDFVAVFPMRGDNRVRLIGRVRGAPGADPHALTFADVSMHAINRMHLVVSKVNWFSTYKVHHRVANSFRMGRAFLLGDAAHIHSPAGGQGMNTGIGDAINLAWKLAAVVKGEATERVLDSYERERIGFARKLVATTDRGFTFATSQSTFVSLVRGFLAAVVLPIAIKGSALRRIMFRTISQTGIKYRESALSAGVAGEVHGGDRLPWVPMSGSDDNFTPLTSMAWQAHVYGEAKASATTACAELRLPLHTFAWSENAARAGLARSALYLVRPDGYVALADRDGDGSGLRKYFTERGLRVGGR
jgi:2-polyprenyl-6-methoxyphenol hydroxylase-like FAD-dependent oxidoreductase